MVRLSLQHSGVVALFYSDGDLGRSCYIPTSLVTNRKQLDLSKTTVYTHFILSQNAPSKSTAAPAAARSVCL